MAGSLLSYTAHLDNAVPDLSIPVTGACHSPPPPAPQLYDETYFWPPSDARVIYGLSYALYIIADGSTTYTRSNVDIGLWRDDSVTGHTFIEENDQVLVMDVLLRGPGLSTAGGQGAVKVSYGNHWFPTPIDMTKWLDPTYYATLFPGRTTIPSGRLLFQVEIDTDGSMHYQMDITVYYTT